MIRIGLHWHRIGLDSRRGTGTSTHRMWRGIGLDQRLEQVFYQTDCIYRRMDNGGTLFWTIILHTVHLLPNTRNSGRLHFRGQTLALNGNGSLQGRCFNLRSSRNVKTTIGPRLTKIGSTPFSRTSRNLHRLIQALDKSLKLPPPVLAKLKDYPFGFSTPQFLKLRFRILTTCPPRYRRLTPLSVFSSSFPSVSSY